MGPQVAIVWSPQQPRLCHPQKLAGRNFTTITLFSISYFDIFVKSFYYFLNKNGFKIANNAEHTKKCNIYFSFYIIYIKYIIHLLSNVKNSNMQSPPLQRRENSALLLLKHTIHLLKFLSFFCNACCSCVVSNTLPHQRFGPLVL